MRFLPVALLVTLAIAGCRQPDHIEIEPRRPVLRSMNDTVQLTGRVMTGDFHHPKKRVRWSSRNESVATVDEWGNVTPVSAGQATIVATWGTFTGEVIVEVDTVVGLRTDVEEIVLDYDATSPIKPRIEVLGYGNRVLRDRSLTFSTENSRICRADARGQFWPGNRGETTITASLEGSSVAIRCRVE